MASVLFSRMPIVKFLIYVVSFFYNYLSEEISGKIHEKWKKISRNFPEMVLDSPHSSPLEFKAIFFDNTNVIKFTGYFLSPSFVNYSIIVSNEKRTLNI